MFVASSSFLFFFFFFVGFFTSPTFVHSQFPNGKYKLSVPFQQSCAGIFELFDGDTFFFDVEGNTCTLITDNSATSDARLHATCVGSGTYDSVTQKFSIASEQICWASCCADAGFTGTFVPPSSSSSSLLSSSSSSSFSSSPITAASSSASSNTSSASSSSSAVVEGGEGGLWKEGGKITDFRWIVQYSGICVCGSFDVNIPIPGDFTQSYISPATCEENDWPIKSKNNSGICINEKPFGLYCIEGSFSVVDYYCRVAGGCLCSKSDLISFQPTCTTDTIWVAPSCSMDWTTKTTNCQELPTNTHGAYCCSYSLTSSPTSSFPSFPLTSSPSLSPSSLPTSRTTLSPSFSPSTFSPTTINATLSPSSSSLSLAPSTLAPSPSPSTLAPSLSPSFSPTFQTNITHGDVIINLPCEVDPITFQILHPCVLDPSGTGKLNISGGNGSVASPLTIILIINNTVVKVTNLSSPVMMVMGFEPSSADSATHCGDAASPYTASCVSRSIATENWSEKGCTIVSQTNHSVTCACTHFTDFAATSLENKSTRFSCTPDPVYTVFATCFALLAVYSCVILLLVKYKNINNNSNSSSNYKSLSKTITIRHLVCLCASLARFFACLVYVLDLNNTYVIAIFSALPYQIESCMFTILVSEWSILVYFSMGAKRMWANSMKKFFVMCNCLIFVCISLLFVSYNFFTSDSSTRQTVSFLGSFSISLLFLIMAIAFFISARNVIKFAANTSKIRIHTCGIHTRIHVVGNLVSVCLVLEAVFDCIAYMVVNDRKIVEKERVVALSFLTGGFLLMSFVSQFLILFLYSKGAFDMIQKNEGENNNNNNNKNNKSSNNPKSPLLQHQRESPQAIGL